jgi:hypothetical protein
MSSGTGDTTIDSNMTANKILMRNETEHWAPKTRGHRVRNGLCDTLTLGSPTVQIECAVWIGVAA